MSYYLSFPMDFDAVYKCVSPGLSNSSSWSDRLLVGVL